MMRGGSRGGGCGGGGDPRLFPLLLALELLLRLKLGLPDALVAFFLLPRLFGGGGPGGGLGRLARLVFRLLFDHPLLNLLLLLQRLDEGSLQPVRVLRLERLVRRILNNKIKR